MDEQRSVSRGRGRSRRTFMKWLLSSVGWRSKDSNFPFDHWDHSDQHERTLPVLGSPSLQPTIYGRPWERRRFRRLKSMQTVKRGACAAPVIILALFGVIHLLETIIGRTPLWWSAELHIQTSSRWKYHLSPHNVAEARYLDAGALRVPIPCHSHNDYWRSRPLFDAIEWGCVSVEADVWHFDGELYVGHTLAALSEHRTLQSLYIHPLAHLLGRLGSVEGSKACLGHGVFDQAPEQTLVLLVDLKTEGRDTFQALQQHLQPLREMGCLSYWDGQKFNSREVTVVGTGNTPLDAITKNASYHDIFFDAPLPALWEPPRKPIHNSDPIHGEDGELDYGTAMAWSNGDAGLDKSHDIPLDSFNTSSSYYASTSFMSSVGFVWRGHISPRQMRVIRGQIRGAKRRGLKVRYWDTPSWPTSLRNHIWHVLVKEGADVLNVDDLAAAALEDWTVPLHDAWFS